MKRLVFVLLSVAALTSGFSAEPARALEKANVLPLSLNDAFQFGKTKTFVNDPELNRQPTFDPSVAFERRRVNFGALTASDRDERKGHYFTFFWKASRKADVTVRLEYRQEKLGGHVMAQELAYEGAKGSMKSDFKVVGDDFLRDGRITAWRVVVIEKGTIVALNQSFLWN